MDDFVCDGCGMSYPTRQCMFVPSSDSEDNAMLCPDCWEAWEKEDWEDDDDDDDHSTWDGSDWKDDLE